MTFDDYLSQVAQSLDTGAQTGVGIGTGNAANAQVQAAYAAILKNLQNRFDDYGALKPAGYQDITAQKLGPSALGSIQNDPQSRKDQQNAIAQYQDVANRGGLNLADTAALDQVQGNLNRNQMARQKGVTNEFAARGQLGSGAQLAADLSGQQAENQSANQAGESAAAQAQQRAMQAVLGKATAAREMGQDDYKKKAAAAQANDAINAHNAAYATDASKYNNSLRGQTYADMLAKLQGENTVTGQLNSALLGSGEQNANTTLANGKLVSSAIGQGGGILSRLMPKSGGSGGSGQQDTFTPSGTDTPSTPGNDNTNLHPDSSDPSPSNTPSAATETPVEEDGVDWASYA